MQALVVHNRHILLFESFHFHSICFHSEEKSEGDMMKTLANDNDFSCADFLKSIEHAYCQPAF